MNKNEESLAEESARRVGESSKLLCSISVFSQISLLTVLRAVITTTTSSSYLVLHETINGITSAVDCSSNQAKYQQLAAYSFL